MESQVQEEEESKKKQEVLYRGEEEVKGRGCCNYSALL